MMPNFINKILYYYYTMSKKKHTPYRTSLRIYKKRTEEALSSYALESGVNKNTLINKIIEDHLERYYTHKSPSTDDLNRVFFSFYSKSKIKTENLRKTNIRYKSLQDFVYKRYYGNLQRKELYLEILLHQYLSELSFLDLFFNKLDINYYHYYKSNNTQFQVQTLAYKEFFNKFITEWYYDLKGCNVINSLTDIEDFNFNYTSLENYIYSICNNKRDSSNFSILKFKYSSSFFKSELERVNQIQREASAGFGNINMKNEIFKQFDIFMKYISELKGELFDIFEFKPHIVFKILNLDDFLKFLTENSLAEQFYDNFTEIFDIRNLTFNITKLSTKKLIKSYNAPIEIMKIYELIIERLQKYPNDTKNLQHDRREEMGELKTIYELFKHSPELASFNLYTRVLLKQFEKIKHFESNLNSFFDSLEKSNNKNGTEVTN